jgi:hypothetical protein
MPRFPIGHETELRTGIQHGGISSPQLHSAFQVEFSGSEINGAEIEAFSDNHIDDDNKHGHKGVTFKVVVTRIANFDYITDKQAYCKITVCQEFSIHEPTKSPKSLELIL